ncbi:hypothetical protein DSO57_1031204 [Entomophthora muscae]|uniref:Uncharacterized protein n=1 Tax=Entomophthora muscae TaxID=34485 RepID=A0ACC2UAE6_9FUNG|nr:hypothetical protein DSO57_1031204 [Entomophthora muscae]
MLSNRKMKVDKSNIISAANPGSGSSSGARQARVRAGANITIIKASTTSVPPSPGIHSNFSISRGASPLTSLSNSSRNSHSTFNDQNLKPQGISPSGPFNFKNVGERGASRSSIQPSESTTNRTNNGYSPTLVQLPLPSISQIQTFQNQILSDNDSDVDSDLSDDTHVTHLSKANSSHSEGTEHSSSSHSGVSSIASDISSSYAVEARVNRKILDLEISNKSLLAVNQILESKVHKQRSELEALKRDIMKLNTGSPLEPSQSKVEDEPDCSDDDECEQQFTRIISRFDTLIAEGRQALEYKPPASGGRVLLPSAL